jgi:DNA-binding IclR family transcriptional regulator
MHVTLGQAAKQSGLSKSTISRAILQGKQFAVRSADTGSYQIE